MRHALFLLLLVGGCEKTDPLYCKMNPTAAACSSAGIDASDSQGDMMTGDARLCFGAGSASVCLSEPPSGPANFPNQTTLDTGSSSSCLPTQPTDWAAAGQPDSCFVVGTSISIDGALTVIGDRPLVMLSSTTLQINADIDAAGHGAAAGPGGPANGCPTPAQLPGASGSGGAGGAGGSFMSQAGDGGKGDNNNVTQVGKPAAADGAPTLLRAGCNGETGGTGDSGVGPGAPGVAGGAVYLIAGGSIAIASAVNLNVSGGGGGKPNRQGGGGGGGSGGMLVLYAPSVTASGALVFANGGGGASGGDDVAGGNSNPGSDPSSPTAKPNGGTGNAGSGTGGSGYYDDGTAHDATNGGDGGSNKGGAGGGGGAGWIQSNVDLTGAVISPAPHVIP